MENQVEQVFFNVPLTKLEPIFKRWMKESQLELHSDGMYQISKKNDESKPLRLEAAAEYLGIAKKSLYGLIYKGKIKPLKPGKHVLFLKSTLDAYLRGEKPTVTTEDPSTYLIRSKRAAK